MVLHHQIDESTVFFGRSVTPFDGSRLTKFCRFFDPSQEFRIARRCGTHRYVPQHFVLTPHKWASSQLFAWAPIDAKPFVVGTLAGGSKFCKSSRIPQRPLAVPALGEGLPLALPRTRKPTRELGSPGPGLSISRTHRACHAAILTRVDAFEQPKASIEVCQVVEACAFGNFRDAEFVFEQ